MPKMPRLLKPHSVTLFHSTGVEDENRKLIVDTHMIDYVNVDVSYGMRQSQKGIENADTAVMVLDLLDLVVDGKKVNSITIAKNDIIEFNNVEYTITKIHDITNLVTGIVEIKEVYLNDR